MHRIVVTEFISLDGVIDSPGGDDGYRHAGWTYKGIDVDPAAYEIKGREQEEATALLLGRTTYDLFAPVWPQMEDFAAYDGMPKYVVSTTLTDPTWAGTTVLSSVAEVARLKSEGDGVLLVHGSGALVRSLAAARLVDRYQLLVFPVLLGAGRRLFGDADQDRTDLRLVEQEAYSNGVVKVVYDVVR